MYAWRVVCNVSTLSCLLYPSSLSLFLPLFNYLLLSLVVPSTFHSLFPLLFTFPLSTFPPSPLPLPSLSLPFLLLFSLLSSFPHILPLPSLSLPSFYFPPSSLSSLQGSTGPRGASGLPGPPGNDVSFSSSKFTCISKLLEKAQLKKICLA